MKKEFGSLRHLSVGVLNLIVSKMHRNVDVNNSALMPQQNTIDYNRVMLLLDCLASRTIKF